MQYRRKRRDAERYIRSLNPVLYISMKRHGDTFLSDDAYGHLCTVTGALWTLQGRSFDGNDNINCGDKTQFDPGVNNFSVFTWARPTALDAASHRILSKQRTVGSAGWILKLDSTNQWAAEVADNGNHTCAPVGGTPTAGVFQFVGFIRTGTTVDIIQNGVIVATATNALLSNVATAGDALFFSGYQGGAVEAWSGLVGESFIYSRALSALEIQRNYLATKWRYR